MSVASEPTRVPIPAGLAEFISVVVLLIEHRERGDFQQEDRYYWNEVCHHEGMIFTVDNDSYDGHIICYVDGEDESRFSFEYSPYGSRKLEPSWEFELDREQLAGVAAGTVEQLALYCCTHPGCGYKSSNAYEACPRCHRGGAS